MYDNGNKFIWKYLLKWNLTEMNILIWLALITPIFILLKLSYRSIYVIIKTFRRDLLALIGLLKVIRFIRYCQNKELSIPKIIRTVAKENASKVAIFFEEEKWTYRQLEDYSNRVANYFKQKGFKKGDTVALLMENRLEYVGLWVGLSKLGVITAFINTNLIQDPLIHCVRNVNSKALIYGSDFQKAVSEVREKLGNVELYEFCTKDLEILKEATDFKSELESQSNEYPTEIENVNIKDKSIYIFTSGTTGLPKAAVITNLKYICMTSTLHFVLSISNKDIVYDPLPLYHAAGGILGIGQSLLFGTSVVIRKKFSASAFWADCKKYNCNVAQYIGELCRFLLVVHKPGTPIDHPVEKMVGNGLRPELWKQFQDTFKIKYINELYGSTEGNVNLANTDGKVGAVGFLPRYASRVFQIFLVKCKEDTGEPLRNKDGFFIKCRPGEPGLLIGKIKRSAMGDFLGYADKKESQKKTFCDVFTKGDKYFNSGDILVQDEFGYLYFRDRTGDTFRWKGENVATNEVEAIISKIIGAVDTVVVYGVEIPGTEGKAGMAAIVDSENKLNVNTFGESLKKNLPLYAIPVFLRIMDSIPLTGTFKYKKNELKKEGYDVNIIKDKLYFFDAKIFGYIPVNNQLYEDVINGRIRI